MYLKRNILPQLLEYIDIFPAVAITGPRQAGKSTLLQHALPNYRYVTLDDHRERAFLESDPEAFMEKYSEHVIFDEAQKAPELFNLIKRSVDQDRKNYGKFILTGSSHFSFIQKIKESLAGRIGLLSLLPLQFKEIPQAQRSESIYRGGYPELVTRHYKGWEAWFSSYLNTYLTRDITDLIHLTDLTDIRRFISLLAANTAQSLNLSTYAKEIGVTVQTIKRWLTVLEASYIVFRLPPYYKNLGKRITKSPKIYFYDTGLVSYLTHIDSENQYKHGPMAGSLFENYIVSEIIKNELNQGMSPSVYYYRSSDGKEIDLIIEKKSQRHLIEIKHTSTPKLSMFDHLTLAQEDGDKLFLLYNGKDFDYGNNRVAINYQDYLKQ